MNILLLISVLAIGVGIGMILSVTFRRKPKARYPIAYHTVDIAIIKRDELGYVTHVLLIQKPHEIKDGHWRFPGGFMDPTDNSAEQAALREADEETKLKVDTDLRYIGSSKIDDPRYRNSSDKIITSFFAAEYISGEVGKGFDDVAVTQWFPVESLPKQNPVHAPLFLQFAGWVKKMADGRDALMQLEVELYKNKSDKNK